MDFVNRFEWAKITAEVFNLDKDQITPIDSKDLNLPVSRPRVNLSNKKIIDNVDYSMKGIREGLLEMYHSRFNKSA